MKIARSKKQNSIPHNIPEKGFYFDNSLDKKGKPRHTYYYDGKKMTGVTTIVGGVFPKVLTWWASGLALSPLGWGNKNNLPIPELDKLAQEGKENIENMSVKEYRLFLQKCYRGHKTELDRTADIGTTVHNGIEDYIKTGHVPEMGSNERKMVDNVLNWFKENNVKVIESEKKLYSVKHWYAGTVDLVIEMDGRKYIADIKTSKQVGTSYFAQMGGYHIMLDEMTKGEHDIKGYVVIRTGRDGTFETVMSEDVSGDKKLFLSALEVFRLVNNTTI